MSRKQITRKWEVFAGRNKFYCNGRIMTAPHSGVFLFTVTLITVTSILFFIYDCTYLAVNVTIAIPIIGALLFLFTMSALLRTSLTDPGIIPRATPDEAAYVEKQIEVTNSANSPTYRPPPRTKEVLIKGQTVKLKYCFTCKIFRPPRASHCSLCDNCVERFDHHCPWVGNCVGRRNYRFFYMFIISLAFLAVFIFFCAVAHLALITKEDGQFLEAVKQSPASMVVAVVCFFSVWSVLGLAGFHTYLTTTNQTTNEDIKGSFTSKRGQDSFNPYSQGNVCLNCFYILCGPLTPSLIDRRGVATAEYRLEVAKPPVIVTEQVGPMKSYPVQEMPPPRTPELTRVYRQTTENTESNAGSVTHLVTSEQPVGILSPNMHQYTSQPCLTTTTTTTPAGAISMPNGSTTPLYSNLGSLDDTTMDTAVVVVTPAKLVKSRSVANSLDRHTYDDLQLDTTDLQGGGGGGGSSTVVLNGHVGGSEATVVNIARLARREHNDLSAQDRENVMLSVSRLKLLRDTTMIASELDLDSLDDSSIGNGSQAGLMKMVV